MSPSAPSQPHLPSSLANTAPWQLSAEGNLHFLSNKQPQPSGLPPGTRAQGEAEPRGPRTSQGTEPGPCCSPAPGSAFPKFLEETLTGVGRATGEGGGSEAATGGAELP